MDELIKIIPTIQSIDLISDNLDKKNNIVKKGVKNILGIEFIKETSKLI